MNTQPATRSGWRSNRLAATALGAALLSGAGLVALTGGSAAGHGWDANAVLRDVDGVRVGRVTFSGNRNGTVVKVRLSDVSVGLDQYHGLHLHANDTAAPCDAAAAAGPFTNVGGHWNPTGMVHGSHAGDLPSIQILGDGSGWARSVTGRFDPADIEGRAVILHAGPDNFANIPTRYVTGEPPVAGPDSATNGAGDAGGRIACGIVEVD